MLFKPSEIRVVILDWSGVVSDDRKPVYASNLLLLDHFGKPRISFEEWWARVPPTLPEFLAMHGIKCDRDEAYELYKKCLDEVIAKGLVPTVYPHAREVFEYLHGTGRKIVVVSSHPQENLIQEAKDYGLAPFLLLIRGNSNDKVVGLKAVCKELGEEPGNVIYLGDTDRDIRAAKEAGVFSGGVCGGYHSKKKLATEKPDILLESGILELKTIFQE